MVRCRHDVHLADMPTTVSQKWHGAARRCPKMKFIRSHFPLRYVKGISLSLNHLMVRVTLVILSYRYLKERGEAGGATEVRVDVK